MGNGSVLVGSPAKAVDAVGYGWFQHLYLSRWEVGFLDCVNDLRSERWW